MKTWKIWFIWFDSEGKRIGAGVYHYEYKHQGNAIRRAKEIFNEPDCQWIVSQENPWNTGRAAEFYKKFYPKGTRIELIKMNDPYAPVPSGAKGTVRFVDDAGQIHMDWDNGRTLALIPDVDTFKKIQEE